MNDSLANDFMWQGNIGIKIRMIIACQNVHCTICMIELTFENGEGITSILLWQNLTFECWTIEVGLVLKRVCGNQRRAYWKPQNDEKGEIFGFYYLPSHPGIQASSKVAADRGGRRVDKYCRWQQRTPLGIKLAWKGLGLEIKEFVSFGYLLLQNNYF